MSKDKRTYEAPDMAKFIARVARAMVRRAAEGDLETLSALKDAQDALNLAIINAGRAAHEGPNAYSWTEIGRELGITRQAAQQRFGTTVPVQSHQAPAAVRSAVNA